MEPFLGNEQLVQFRKINSTSTNLIAVNSESEIYGKKQSIISYVASDNILQMSDIPTTSTIFVIFIYHLDNHLIGFFKLTYLNLFEKETLCHKYYLPNRGSLKNKHKHNENKTVLLSSD